MNSRSISHIALRVESLRQAEAFYSRLFDLQVLCRCKPDRAGSDNGPSLLGRADFRLVLMGEAREPGGSGRLAHVGVRLPRPDIDRLAERAPALGCRLEGGGPGQLYFEDVYGVRWRVAAEPAERMEDCRRTGP